MPEPNATLAGGTHQEAVAAATRAKNKSDNPEYTFMGNANLEHTPAYFVYIFNVSEREARIERPWVNFNPAARGKLIVVPARQEGERVSKPFRISDIVQIPIRNDANRTVQTMGQRGEFLAQDAINPEDPTGNWKTLRATQAGFSLNQDTNLYHWGLFWTKNQTPTDEEVNSAVGRLEANYNRLIEEAKMLWAQGDKGKQQIGTTHRTAASYFSLEFEWNMLYRSLQECPGCGTRISKNVVVCPNCPATFDWAKALALGLRTKQQATDAGILEGQAEEFAAAPKRKRAAKN